MGDRELMYIGECAECGYVTEDDGADIEFPNKAECHCGETLERATVAEREEVEKYA